MTKLSRRTRLVIFGLIGVVTLTCFLDYYHNLNWFAGYDWYAMLIGLALLMFGVILVAEGNSDRRSP